MNHNRSDFLCLAASSQSPKTAAEASWNAIKEQEEEEEKKGKRWGGASRRHRRRPDDVTPPLW